jgi:tyrosyl-tRNA synthetase
MKLLTLMDFEQIEKVVQEHNKKPELRYGQKVLAEKVVEIIH